MPEAGLRGARWAVRRARSGDRRGGGARARVVLTMAAVLGLSGADTGTISSTTGNLERAFHVGNTQIGLLLTVVGLTGALFTIPARRSACSRCPWLAPAIAPRWWPRRCRCSSWAPSCSGRQTRRWTRPGSTSSTSGRGAAPRECASCCGRCANPRRRCCSVTSRSTVSPAARRSAVAGACEAGNPTGLEYTFLIFLVPLIVAGPLPLAALRAYPRDVATAIASVRAVNAERDRTSGPARES